VRRDGADRSGLVRSRGGTVVSVGTPEPRSIRIGTTEREQAVTALGDHFAQGRLDPQEFEERMAAAYTARTADDLDRLFDDLPRAGLPPHHPGTHPAPPPTAPYPAPYPGAYPVPAGHPHAYPAVHGGYDPQAPHGREPGTGQPYSDRSKVVAGLLQLLLPIGIGRLYSGHVGIGVAQLVLTLFFGIGAIWAFIDGIVILAGRPTDPRGRPLHP
jgi:Domain of unknown function (DUF1707)/TM2 domain